MLKTIATTRPADSTPDGDPLRTVETALFDRGLDEVLRDPAFRYVSADRHHHLGLPCLIVQHRDSGTIWWTRRCLGPWRWRRAVVVERSSPQFRDAASGDALYGEPPCPRVALAGPIARFMARHGAALDSLASWSAAPEVVRAVHLALANSDGWAAVRALGALRSDPDLARTTADQVLPPSVLPAVYGALGVAVGPELGPLTWAWCAASRELGATAEDDGEGLVRRPEMDRVRVHARASELLARPGDAREGEKS
jgi:hypothetical protein